MSNGKVNKIPEEPNPKMFTKQKEQVTETGTSSVSIVKNSKGVNFTVKVYDEDPISAKQTAEDIFDQLDKKYTVATN